MADHRTRRQKLQAMAERGTEHEAAVARAKLKAMDASAEEAMIRPDWDAGMAAAESFRSEYARAMGIVDPFNLSPEEERRVREAQWAMGRAQRFAQRVGGTVRFTSASGDSGTWFNFEVRRG